MRTNFLSRLHKLQSSHRRIILDKRRYHINRTVFENAVMEGDRMIDGLTWINLLSYLVIDPFGASIFIFLAINSKWTKMKALINILISTSNLDCILYVMQWHSSSDKRIHGTTFFEYKLFRFCEITKCSWRWWLQRVTNNKCFVVSTHTKHYFFKYTLFWPDSFEFTFEAYFISHFWSFLTWSGRQTW